MMSKFFSENLKILPKYVDLINFPLFAIIFLLLIFSFKRKSQDDEGTTRFILVSMLLFTIATITSIIFNSRQIIFGASLLFYMGMMEGPFLFIGLNKYVKNTEWMINKLKSFFVVLLFFNLAIVFFLNIPEFLITGNPDKISGAYGNNQNQFSTLLLINGAYLLGYNFIKKKRAYIVILSQIVIFIVFYLSQFRAGAPFFLLSYLIIIGVLYGKKIIYRSIPVIIVALMILFSLVYLTQSDKKVESLRFDDWIELISNPEQFFYLGKFKIFGNVVSMFSDYPETIILGTGPGNFISRANYTFTYEINIKDKGVGSLIKDIFGIKYTILSDYHYKYVFNSIPSEAVLGTYQLANPSTSYLAALSEIGLIGGITIIAMYIFLFVRSIKLFRIIRDRRPEYLPMSLSLVAITSYVFQLAFLENYWEMARVTLPLWLLFWAVKTAVYSNDNKIIAESTSAEIQQNNPL